MKTELKLHLLLLTLLSLSGFAHAQSTAFTYNGRLKNNALPANGAYEMQFTLYAGEVGGLPVAGPIPINAVDVVNGLFTVRVDFLANVFTGPARWLEVAVRPAGAPNFSLLTPRQEVTSSPYSIRAQTAGSVANGTVTANQLNTGGVEPAPGQFLSYSAGNLFWADPGVAAGDIFSRGVNGTDAYYNAGNVGIGTGTPAESLTIAGVASYNTGLKLTGNADNGVGLALENAAPGGHKYAFLSGGLNTGVGPGGFGIFDDTALDYRFAISAGGNVGIGTANPILKLHVEGDEFLSGNVYFGERTRQIFNMFGTGFGIGVQTANLYSRSGGGFAWHLGGAHSDATYDSGGGTTLMTLDIGGLSFGARLGQHLRLWSASEGNRYFGIGIQAETLYARCGDSPGDGFAWHKGGFHHDGHANPGGGRTLMTLDEETGLVVNNRTTTRVLTITGGADIAEPFDLTIRDIAKGSVVVIDEDHPGKLKLSTRAYDTQVAGIVSGANGIQPGISLYQQGAIEGGQNVALSGRVYVQADASTGAIKPGDLLTTSDTPGHAMKVPDHTRASGAILGKAMSGLNEGKGMVLVLVTLQ
jgi:hypothetical protein